MNFNRDSRFMNNTKRRNVLLQMKVVEGKAVSYEKFLRDYLRSMSFTYHVSGCNAKKYSRIMNMCESMAQKQWESLPAIKEQY